MKANLALFFPKLQSEGFQETSPQSVRYNCIAWAAGNQENWWWPTTEPGYYWPEGVPGEVTVDAFIAAFATLGYERSNDASLEVGFEKIALFHAQRWYRLTPLRRLHLGMRESPTEYSALLNSPHVRNLTSLVFSDRQGLIIKDDDAMELASSPHLVNLGHIHLANHVVGRAGIQALLDSPHLANLKCIGPLKGRPPADLEGALLQRFGSDYY